MENLNLVHNTIEKLQKSYAPYSNFNVACAITTESGEVFYGVNVENASYGLTICAERAAICNMIANGTNKKIAQVLVLSKAKVKTPPCGACRQVIYEFANNDCKVIMPHGSDYENHEQVLAAELIPHGFKLDD